MIIALAGRRVDAPNAIQRRFPAEHAALVKQRISEFFQTHNVSVLVCAAACGADILALEAAGKLGLRRRIVLPFDSARFRATSVIDRPGDWGARYDRLIAEVERAGELIENTHDPEGGETWFTGNLDVLEEAQALARKAQQEAAALVVWNGESRGADDVTAHFYWEAQRLGMEVAEILTL